MLLIYSDPCVGVDPWITHSISSGNFLGIATEEYGFGIE